MADGQAEVKIVTFDAVTNLNELRESISNAKNELNKMTIGSEEYRKQLVEIDKAQMILRNAINGTTAKEEDYTKALQGTSKTYNTLVKQMADMKKALRNIDVSTEEGVKEFEDLAKKINSVNDELKAMDAMKGDYQRNVGNYVSHWKGLGDALSKLPGPIGTVSSGIKGMNDSLSLMGKQPILGIIGLLAPIITEIVNGLKDNKAVLDGTKKAMDALKPVMDFLSGLLETIGSFLGDIIKKSASFLSSNGIFQKIVQGVMGVGNAILQFVIAPFKGIAAAIKVFREEGIKGIGNAAKAFGQEMKSGVSFKQNFETGQTIADTIIAGAKSRKKKAKKAGKDIVKETLKSIQEEFDKDFEKLMDDIDKKSQEIAEKAMEAAEKQMELARKREDAQLAGIEKTAQRQLEYNDILTENEREKEDKAWEIQQLALERRLQAIAEFRDKAMDRGDIERVVQYEQEMADLQVDIEQSTLARKKKLREQDKQDALDTMNFFASATSGILGNLANALENEGKSAKNIRIAQATIDMISGAVTALSTAQQLGPIAGPIVGAINAAAVVASGLANIAKIKSTSVSKDSAPTASTAATVSAPSMPTVSPTTVTTGASTQTALNQAAQPQKVYILQSDIEAAGSTAQVQVAESSF